MLIKQKINDFFSSKYNLNAIWLLSDKVLRLLLGLFISVFVTRYLGPQRFGTLNYLLAITSIFGIFSSLGMDSLIIKDLIDKKYNVNEILGTSYLMKLFGGLIVIFLSFLWVLIFDFGNADLLIYILITSFCYLIIPFEVLDFYFQSLSKSRISVKSKFIALFFSISFKFFALYLKLDLFYFILIGTIEVLISYLLLNFYYHQSLGLSILKWKFNKKFMLEKYKQVLPLALSGFVIIIYMRIDQIMIKHLINEQAVGLYSASVRIAEVWYFIPLTIVSSYFPFLLAIKNDQKNLIHKQKFIYSFLLIISISLAFLITVFSDEIISSIYGNDFASSASTLKINIWTGVFVSLGVASNSYMTLKNILDIQLYRTILGVITNIALNYLFIPSYGIIGAAYATLLAQLVSAYLSTWIFKSTRSIFYDMTHSFINIFKLNFYF